MAKARLGGLSIRSQFLLFTVPSARFVMPGEAAGTRSSRGGTRKSFLSPKNFLLSLYNHGHGVEMAQRRGQRSSAFFIFHLFNFTSYFPGPGNGVRGFNRDMEYGKWGKIC